MKNDFIFEFLFNNINVIKLTSDHKIDEYIVLTALKMGTYLLVNIDNIKYFYQYFQPSLIKIQVSKPK